MRILSPVLAALLLLPVTSAGAVTLTDPAGDASFPFSAAPLAPACADDAVDLTALEVASDGVTLSARLSAVDLAGGLVCAGQPLDAPVATFSWTVTVAAPGQPPVKLSASQTNGSSTSCTWVGWSGAGPATSSPPTCTTGGALAGTTLAWSVPLTGPLGASGTYDLRGLSAVAYASAQENAAAVVVAMDRIDAASVGTL